jgi:FimV-like protein
MNPRRLAGTMLLAGAAALAVFDAVPAHAQAASTYEVRKGDTLFGIARKSRHDGVTRNQMILAIYRANQSAFAGGNIHRLDVGTVLTIPSRAEVEGIASAEADQQLRELLATKPAAAAPPVAAVKPAPAEKVPAASSAASTLSAEAAARRYREGLGMERRGDHRGALIAFLEAGEAGHGAAQRKLGQIYDKGNRAVPRDYQASLKWYQKAREQGVEIDKPLPRMGPP